MIINRIKIVFLSAIMLVATSCLDVSTSEEGANQDLTTLIEKQELFEKKLNQIVKKIDNLQTSVNKIKTAPPTANNKDNKKNNNKRKPADPNYVHDIPQGDSYFIGNPDAVVTITEFFDFQ